MMCAERLFRSPLGAILLLILTLSLAACGGGGGGGNGAGGSNQPPVANAGSNQGVTSGQAITLDGSASHDPDGTITSYAWVQTSGATVTLGGANTNRPTFTAPAVTATTNFVFQLTVTDNNGAANTATVQITVSTASGGSNQPPVASAGANQSVASGQAVALDGSASSDPDGTIASYAWTQTSGAIVTLGSANTNRPTFTAPTVTATTTLAFQLTVTDNNGAATSATVQITVVPAGGGSNQPPVANAGTNQSVTSAQFVTLDSSASYDPDGTIMSGSWTQISGAAVTLTGANTRNATFTAPIVTAMTTLAFQLTVIDNNGATSTATVQITVTSGGTLSLLAGNAGGAGNADGTGAAARFNGPGGVATDSAGNVYVADMNNHTIRKITPAGVVTTLAGMAGVWGSADGTGAVARFNSPAGVATDSVGNVYVADENNYTIRKITPAGVVTTLAGSAGAYGSADGTGAAARFNLPVGVATDSAGNIYVADLGNYTIRRITPAGVVTTLAGTAGVSGSADGIGAAARFMSPVGVATDSAGNIYVSDSWNHTIRKITPVGVVTTLPAWFSMPQLVATDSAGNVYVADDINRTIHKISPAGVVTTLAGTAGLSGSADGTGAAARFKSPVGVATDSAGNVYVADWGNNNIRKINPAGVVTTLAGPAGAYGSADGTGAAASFNSPGGVATDSVGNVYVTDTSNHTIRKITPAGVVTTLAGTAGVIGSADGIGAAAMFYYPQGIATDSADNVYVADTWNYTIRKITPAGVVTTLAGNAGTGAGSVDGTGAAARFFNPQGVVADCLGNVYVADTRNYTIRKITPAGVVTTLAGKAGVYGSADDTGAAARFKSPDGVATDSVGNVYVADSGNNTIRKITPAGVVTTMAGTAGMSGNADGIGIAARFNNPRSVTTDSAGNVYVADSGNNTIRKITPVGAVTTVVGQAGVATFTPGNLPGALVAPYGVALYGNTLYTTTNNAIVKAAFAP